MSRSRRGLSNSERHSIARAQASEPRIDGEHRLADYAGYRQRYDVEWSCNQCHELVAPYASHGHLR